ncbi:fasciclin domain-containing protein [Meiothermus granaticius]|uniref:Immunogenic protein MPB70 n=1 Tax=Meiothermus granaticius NBRC 107808 TaxID=1227551 RepID=A0A399F8L2_9DEIN|nr:fasciclin domain-containing protein [Meiothermus granaticius]MCL6525394.1 fasciclin domain-containing protein [Thermaceae bacterium]RIH92994.1 Immunogenic protein MPB70 [Meiothermus granaticius NBRC 107808]GEM86168.1 hypothetical protein MGR01S_07930 [Meiothermus granaticius NBRC 107808]
MKPRILLVLAALAIAALGWGQAQSMSNRTIAEIVASNPQFSTLLTALKAAGLEQTLAEKGPFTVFAPTNEAFAKIPKATLEALLKDKAQLTKILTYHVVAGVVKAADVVKLSKAKTLEGSDITIAVKDGKVVLNGDSTVIQTDIEASNGVIHVIDTVLMPPMK